MIVELGTDAIHTALIASTALSGAAALFFYNTWSSTKSALGTLEESFNHLHEGYYRSSLSGKQLSANPALVRLNGYNSEQELLESVKSISKEWYVDPDRRAKFKELLERDGQVINFISEIYRHKTRERIWVSENARIVHDSYTLEPLHYEGTVREITSEILHRKSQDRLAKLAVNLPGGLFQLVMKKDNSFNAPYVSDRFIELLARPDEPFNANPISYLKHVHNDDLNMFKDHCLESIRNFTPMDTSFRYKKGDGDYIWLQVNATVEKGADDSITWYGHIFNITKQKIAEEKANRLAYTDSLTGLANRSVAEDKLRAVIHQCERRDEHAACVFIDLDNFKELNDINGHEAGDELLTQVASRLNNIVRASDLVSRYGGDEFVIIIDNLGSNFSDAKEKAAGFATKVQNSFKDSFQIGPIEHNSTPSIGVAMIKGDMPNPSEILRQADNAMYQAKKNGRNNYVIYGGNTLGSKSGFSGCDKDLVGAVGRNEFKLVFQPQMDSQSRICGAEAFIRWHHPSRGVVMPSDFMPSAEKNGIIVEINNWVIDKAIEQIRIWEKSDKTSHLNLAINLGIQQFSIRNFANDLEAKLFKAGVGREKLIFELTESVLNRNGDRSREQMIEIKKCGVSFALDDFGIGSSSLASLNKLPFDQVKIDGLLVAAIESEAQTRSLIEGILGVAKALGMEPVAEQVNSQFQEKFLFERGCKFAQGYYYFAPMEIDAFDNAVDSNIRAQDLKLVS